MISNRKLSIAGQSSTLRPRIVFVVNCWHRDEHLARRLGAQLDQHYSDASSIVLPDVPRLKDKLTGEWTLRYLEWSLSSGADVIIKLDPDACVWRRATIPEADWFGTMSVDGTFVRGGACGFSREAAGKLIASQILLEETPFSYPRYDDYRWPHEERDSTPLSCQDRIVGAAMARLGILPSPWRDVLILGNENRVPDESEIRCHAITHPHPQ